MSILTERYIEFVMAGRDLNPITNTLLPDRERAPLHDTQHPDTTDNDTQRYNQIQKLWTSTKTSFVSFMTKKNTPLATTNNATPKSKDAYADCYYAKCCNEDDYAECR